MRLLLPILLLVGTANAQAHLDTARVYIGTVEEPGNHGPEVERFLASVGLGPGYPYCAAFVSYCLTAGGAVLPRTRSAVAQRFISRYGRRASAVKRGRCVPAGTIVIWKKGQGPYGHVGFVDQEWCGPAGWTVEANTSPGAGSQRDGDGVYRRWRTIQPGNYFRIAGFAFVR